MSSLQIGLDDPDAAEVDHSYARATEQQPRDSEPTVSDLELEQEGLAFIAGYVASKMRHVDPSLDCPTGDASDEHLASVPSSWLLIISRGGLYVPHSWWMAVVRQYDKDFCTIMGPTFTKEPGIVQRLTDVIRKRHPSLDVRVARRLAKTSVYIRVQVAAPEYSTP